MPVPFPAVEGAFSAQSVFGEELDKGIAPEIGERVVRLEQIKRRTAAPPVDVAGGKLFHSRKDFFAGKTVGWEGAAHGG